MGKNKVLILIGYYLPGYKAGGPIKSIKNIIDNLYNEFDFHIVTKNSDIDGIAYENVKTNCWLEIGHSKVYYIDNNANYRKTLKKLIYGINPDVIYINSFFDYRFSILPLIILKYHKSLINKIILAPRGQFSLGALYAKKLKKKCFLFISKLFKLHKNIIWHSTSANETEDIRTIFPEYPIVEISNLPKREINENDYNIRKKYKGSINVVFLSRIHPKKNLLKALQILNQCQGDISFDIYGPIEDAVYWEHCKSLIKIMNNNVKVQYKGAIESEKVELVFNKYHLFLFPTLGENFGHVMYEALISGCILLTTPYSPFTNLSSYGIGANISLEQTVEYISEIHKIIEYEQITFDFYSKKAHDYAVNKINLDESIKKYLILFGNYEVIK